MGDWRRLYVLQHPLAATLALGAVLATLVLALMPAVLADTAIGTQLPGPLEYLWLAAWGGGGALVLLGYWRLEARFEVPGLILSSVAYIDYVLALAGAHGKVGLIGIIIVGLVGGGMAGRAAVILTRPEVTPWDSRT